MMNLNNKYIVLDVETTGLPKNYQASLKQVDNWPHIVQFAWIVFDDGKIEEKSFIIKPNNYVIPEESTEIHGITNEKALNGTSLKTVLKQFKIDCENVDKVIAHNSSFDISVVLAACYRIKSNASFLKNKKVICTMKTTTNLCKLPGKYGHKYPKLEELFTFLFNKKPDVTLHDALEDSRITFQCYQELLNRNYKMT